MTLCFAFYAEIHDDCKKWWDNDIWQKTPDHSAYTLPVKNFVEITLSRNVSKIQEIQDGCQKGGKMNLEKSGR